MGLERPETQGHDEMQLTLSGGVLWGNIITKLMCALGLNQEVFLTEKKHGPPRPWPCKESAGTEAQRPVSYEVGITFRDEMSICLSVGMGLCFSASLSQPYMGAQE